MLKMHLFRKKVARRLYISLKKGNSRVEILHGNSLINKRFRRKNKDASWQRGAGKFCAANNIPSSP
jgi:hypothetical protein